MGIAELIKALEIELLQPEVRKSKDRLNELISDGFIEIGESGKQYNKQDILSALPMQTGLKFSLRDFKATEISSNVVLATFHLEKEITESREKIISLRSSIWKNKNGKWQIVFHQGTKINFD
ncbi:MAG: DUF4440 domain-containing protein [Ignavibacteriaceae bacterium]